MAGGALVGGSVARADVIDLITNNSVGPTVQTQGVVFTQTKYQPAGTGVIDPFLTIQAKNNDTDGNPNTEEGFNSDSGDSSQLLDDTRANSAWVTSVKLDDIKPIVIGGISYAQFLLDINESKNGIPDQYLSMQKLELFSTTKADLVGYAAGPGGTFATGVSGDGFGSNATMLYNMDANTDLRVDLNYGIDHGGGSGKADLYVYVPYDLLTKGGTELGQNKYLVLYSSFGEYNNSGYSTTDGYEEWTVVLNDNAQPSPGPGLPLPSTAAGGALVLGAMGFCRRSRRGA
jgi:hypothetical protein